MKRALVFGGSGQIGTALIARLLAAGWEVHAVSRRPRTGLPRVQWVQGDFASMPVLPRAIDAIYSAGPLDLFSSWYPTAPMDCPQVVAFGSTSVLSKRAATDPGERALAQRLFEAEAQLREAAAAKGCAATLLRPTLVYGLGRDRNLSSIAALARRTGFFVLPAGATGLRQPVHVEDLAQAACAAAEGPAGMQRDYALPGGETLPYREMVARVLAALPSKPRLVELPSPLFRLLLAGARAGGVLRDLPGGAVARMREDLVFDDAPARRELAYAPRPFQPTAAMFEVSG
ncbi:NAD(P)-dependent oxidoreductase [Luteimonas vadosa]|uniref:NAD-dependent epimerase/dehydratase family protein n=1 Tax=Luteimonas vadosa TaxID=1165507 RepID=A0ABP9DNP5_9GAMM